MHVLLEVTCDLYLFELNMGVSFLRCWQPQVHRQCPSSSLQAPIHMCGEGWGGGGGGDENGEWTPMQHATHRVLFTTMNGPFHTGKLAGSGGDQLASGHRHRGIGLCRVRGYLPPLTERESRQRERHAYAPRLQLSQSLTLTADRCVGLMRGVLGSRSPAD